MHVFTQIRGFGAPRKVSYAAVNLNPPGDVQVIERPSATNPPPTAAPPSLRSQCDAIWNTLIAGSTPSIRTCLTSNPQHKGYYNNVCMRLALGQMNAGAASAEWADYVTRNCATHPPPSTARTPRASTPTHVRQPTPTAVPGESISIPPAVRQDDDNDSGNPPTSSGGSPGGDTDGDDQKKKGFLRQLGGVVGVGLFVAVGLTVARDKKFMRKLTGKRARR